MLELQSSDFSGWTAAYEGGELHVTVTWKPHKRRPVRLVNMPAGGHLARTLILEFEAATEATTDEVDFRKAGEFTSVVIRFSPTEREQIELEGYNQDDEDAFVDHNF